MMMKMMMLRNHPSINTLRRFSQRNSSIYFSPVDKNTLLKETKGFSANKAVKNTDIPVTVLKENVNFFVKELTLQFNEGIRSSKFAESFKLSNITPAFKQGSRNLKDNYRPIILPIISKIFEKLLCKQLSNHFDNICFQNLNLVFERDLVRSK